MKRPTPAVSLVLLVLLGLIALYAGILYFGLPRAHASAARSAVLPNSSLSDSLLSASPTGPEADAIRRGQQIFNHTPLYAPRNTGASISCTSCHAEGGTQPFASPMVGIAPLFPMFNARAGHIISLKDRIQECFVRSENGTPLNEDGPEMQALVSYINALSPSRTPGAPSPNHTDRDPAGRGLIHLPTLQPNPAHGAEVYAAQCAGCHGQQGQGQYPTYPALWGPDSFNDGAGMDTPPKLAAFIQHNMPQNRMGTLSPQQAWDVAAYIHRRPRPHFNPTYAHY